MGLTVATLCTKANDSSINRSRSLIQCITARPHAKRALQRSASGTSMKFGADFGLVYNKEEEERSRAAGKGRLGELRRPVPPFEIQICKDSRSNLCYPSWVNWLHAW